MQSLVFLMASSTSSSFADSSLIISALILAASASGDERGTKTRVPELDLLEDPGESVTDICQCPELVSRCHCTLVARHDTTMAMAMVVAANASASRANDVV